MTDVPPNDGEDAAAAAPRAPGQGYPPPPSVPPPAFDDDALAAALEADIAPYTSPVTIIPPAPAQPVARPPADAAPAVPPAAAPAASPLMSPAYEIEYEAPDVPEYVVPPAPPTPDYEVPPAPEAADYEPPPAPTFDAPTFDAPPAPADPFVLPEEPGAGESGPSTLDAIQRLEDELRRQALSDASTPGEAWEPALDHPAAGHVFPAPYAPFTDPVTITQPPAPAQAAPEQSAPEQTAPEHAADTLPPEAFSAEPIAPAAPPPPSSDEWLAAPPPSFEVPPLVEPPPSEAPTPPTIAGPTDGASYVAPTVLPPLREIRLEDVQGLPPPVGQQAAAIPPYDPAAAPTFGAAPVAPPPSVPPFAASPDAADPFAAAGPAPVSPDSFAGAYATPIPDAPPFGATEPASLDENDDAIDDVDRMVGSQPPLDAPLGSAGAYPSEPISTQRVTETQPGLVDQKPENHPVFVVESAGVEPTALDLRAGRAARLFWLWFATNSSILSVAVGAVVFSMGMSLRQAIVATLAGVALSFLPLGLGTLAGKWSGQPTMVVSRATFGHVGNILPALLAVLTRVFWGGVLLWVLGVSVARLLVFAGLDAGLGEAVWTFVIVGIGVVIAGVVALFGYGFVARLQLILSILSGLLVAGIIYFTYPRLDLATALAIGDGSWWLVVGGVVVVFSFVGLAWVQSSSDVSRYQRPASSGAQSMLWATVGATLPPFALIAWGAMLAASDPVLATGLVASPLPTIARLLPLWYPAPLLAAAGLGLLSSVVLAIYSGGFALQALGLKTRRSITSVLTAVLVAAVAAGLVVVSADAIAISRDLATTLAVPVAAWAGIFAAEMMIRTRRFDSPSLVAPGGVYPQIRIANFLGFLLLSGVGYGLTTATFPGLTWQGFLFPLLGVPADSPLATSDLGVLVALVLGIIVPLATAIPAIRKQERASLYLEHTGPIPRITGSIPRQTGSIPRQTGAVPRQTGAVPRQAGAVAAQTAPAPGPTGPTDFSGLPAPTSPVGPPPRLEP